MSPRTKSACCCQNPWFGNPQKILKVFCQPFTRTWTHAGFLFLTHLDQIWFGSNLSPQVPQKKDWPVCSLEIAGASRSSHFKHRWEVKWRRKLTQRGRPDSDRSNNRCQRTISCGRTGKITSISCSGTSQQRVSAMHDGDKAPRCVRKILNADSVPESFWSTRSLKIIHAPPSVSQKVEYFSCPKVAV